MSGNFLSCSKGVKDPLEVPEVRCDYPRDASVEMGIISLRGEKLLDFLELRQVPSTYNGAFRDSLWCPQERPVPMRVARGPLGIALPLMPGPKTLCGSVLEPEDFSPVLTWILGYFWSLPWESVLVSSGVMHVRLPPKLYQQCHASLHVDQGICGFTSRLCHEAFPRGFPQGSPTCHRGVTLSSD